MRRIRNSIINWLIKNSAISEENRELYEYAVYSAELLVLPVIMAIVIGWLSGSPVNGVSPIQSDNKVLNEKEMRHYKKVVVMQLAVYSIIIICSSILKCIESDVGN